MSFSRALDWWYRRQLSRHGEGKIILVGMHKSGTTAISRLLGAAINERVSSDPFYRIDQQQPHTRQAISDGRIQFADIVRQYPRHFSSTVIKDPHFPLMLPQISEVFPKARLISIIRDPRDTIRSVLNRLDLPGDPNGVDLEARGIPHGWWLLLTGKSPAIPGENYIEVLARRWSMIADELVKLRPNAIEIRYEDFRADKKTAIYSLAAALGYATVTPIDKLLDIQYQPRGQASVTWDRFYPGAELNTIERICAKLMQEYGYELHPKT